MIRRLFAALLFVFFATPALARIGTLDQVPASTLLFPNFEVDTSSPSGVNTILTLQNSSASATMVNVVLWTDLGIPTARFNVYLTGFDVETIDMANVFRRFTPVTASAGQDPTDAISHHGPISQDINFASCTGFIPTPPQGGRFSRNIVGAHTGQANIDYFNGLCGSRNYGDNIARGYVTVDVTNQCTLQVPGDPGYFSVGGGGVAGNRNIMLGDYAIVDPATNRLYNDSAVHIEADALNPITAAGANKQTFYARLVGYGAIDNREPLPTAWAGRYAGLNTNVDYWRDPGAPVAPFACGTAPGVPSGQHVATVYNDLGTPVANLAGDLFPFAEGTALGGALGFSQPVGWAFFNLNLTAPSGPLGAIRQSWVNFRGPPVNGSVLRFSAPGISLGNAATGADPANP